MNFEQEIINVVRDTLELGDRASDFSASTAFNDIPEFDSMSVATLISALEEKFGFSIENGELTEDIFQNIGSLTKFVESKVS